MKLAAVAFFILAILIFVDVLPLRSEDFQRNVIGLLALIMAHLIYLTDVAEKKP